MQDRVGGNGIALSDYNRHASIVDNEIAHPGENGVLLVGKARWVDGLDGNQPRWNTVARNVIHHVGLYTKQSCAIFYALSCQNTIASNVMFAGQVSSHRSLLWPIFHAKLGPRLAPGHRLDSERCGTYSRQVHTAPSPSGVSRSPCAWFLLPPRCLAKARAPPHVV